MSIIVVCWVILLFACLLVCLLVRLVRLLQTMFFSRRFFRVNFAFLPSHSIILRSEVGCECVYLCAIITVGIVQAVAKLCAGIQIHAIGLKPYLGPKILCWLKSAPAAPRKKFFCFYFIFILLRYNSIGFR